MGWAQLCEEGFRLTAGRVTVIASAWHAGYGGTAELTEWYRRVKPPRAAVVCLFLRLQCFPLGPYMAAFCPGGDCPLHGTTDAIADAVPPCGVARFLALERLGGRLVDRLPDRGTVVDYAAGIGGWAIGLYEALRAAGHAAEYTVYAYDIDPRRLSVYKRAVERHTGWRVVARRVDLRRRLPEESPDVAVGSPPCEDFSVANHYRDERRGLELVVRYLDYVDAARPRVALFEEVATLRAVRGALEGLLRRRGWAYEVVDFSALGVPQARRRRILGWRA